MMSSLLALKRPRATIVILCAINMVMVSTLCVLAEAQCPGLAEGPDGEARLREYRYGCLTVEPIGVGESISGPLGMTDHSSWTKWIASKGYEQVSEPQFYELCGESSLALTSAKRIQKARSSRVLGIAMGVVGAIVSGIAIYQFEERCNGWYCIEEWAPAYEIAIPALIVGLVGVGLELSAKRTLNRNHVPYGKAREMADDFNEALCRQLKE